MAKSVRKQPNLHRFVLLMSTLAGALGTLSAQVPDEVSNVGFAEPGTLTWTAAANADLYNVYRGSLSLLEAGIPAACHGFRVDDLAFGTPAAPEAGAGFFYIVTGESATAGEGPPGNDSDDVPRPLLGSCPAVMRNHVLNRTGYGWSEWARDRVGVLGLAGYVDEQLDPASIDESDNVDLNARLAGLIPPERASDLVGLQIVRGVYARRQLEQQATSFWANHFNTFNHKVDLWFRELFPDCESPGVPPQCDEAFPARSQKEAALLQYSETEAFRDLAFAGNFRQLVEASALSPAMIIYLDSVLSTAGTPNENFPRELLELYTMGVDGGYTQTDVEELSRALTGWGVCKKEVADLDDPLAPCIADYWDPLTFGEFVADFDPLQHDCTEKTLFAGTPHETVIPDTCADPAQGVNDLHLALDAIVSHPATPRFISFKILERFVAEEPDQAMIDAMVAVWNNSSNPHGVGDMRAVLDAALDLPVFLDPDRVGGKIKTPMEHVISALRAVRGRTDGVTTVSLFLLAMAHQVHLNPAPTGWAEAGFNWINTNNMLDRQNFAYELVTSDDEDFSDRVLSVLTRANIDIEPGNSEEIVDFYSDVLFGKALTPAERQAAIDYLDTNDLGQPSPYDSDRIRAVVGVMMGFPQFEEQ